ncbi:lytic transglycosylase domain-containing protein [Mycetocola reblochoni]|uniref:Transglycosylase SLT domain-containing protein n=2 Tax=Mycetocola reblochoni TaxID=331618 RepID=A0A3L6ZQF2_9MICO|nr:lytic transglycosylase domain-containing protein [Mycetocola reblochoni]RLP69292.1 hypothetical protein D9V30_08270 [Mycetocola reblochoni]SJN22195.1 similar to membrane-bound lytic murein transglycosylase B [Mycetocola reblochoni REB411]
MSRRPTTEASPTRTDRRLIVVAGLSLAVVAVGVAVVAGTTLLGGSATEGAAERSAPPSATPEHTSESTSSPTASETPSQSTSATPNASETASSSAGTAATGERAPAVSELVDDGWVDTVSERVGIPRRALSAYAGAALDLAERIPGCALSWNTLAGIGYVESRHGTLGGGAIGGDGITRPTLIGIALDGTASRAVADTDRGRLDGDAAWDRAIGPMQFTPESWERYGTDGSGDGLADPQNIDDAAVSAGEYLCAAGGELGTVDNWVRAVAAYNDASDYNAKVVAAADHYATAAG